MNSVFYDVTMKPNSQILNRVDTNVRLTPFESILILISIKFLKLLIPEKIISEKLSQAYTKQTYTKTHTKINDFNLKKTISRTIMYDTKYLKQTIGVLYKTVLILNFLFKNI